MLHYDHVVPRLVIKNHGIVLFSVLLFLQIFTLLAWYAVENSLLALRSSLHDWQEQNAMLEAEQSLHQAENKLFLEKPSCMIAQAPEIFLRTKSIEWWDTQNFCHEKSYYYVVESLGEDPCAIVDYNKNSHAYYYRITLFRVPEKILLQSTIVMAEKKKLICESVQHVVYVGRQFWREI